MYISSMIPRYAVIHLSLYLIETHFNKFANKADPDQAALLSAV